MAVAAILVNQSNVDHPEKLKEFLDITVSKVKQLTDEIYFLNPGNNASPAGIQPLALETSYAFLDYLSQKLTGKCILILNAYSPLLDIESAKDMLSQHQKHSFDYTYPENLPAGLLPEIFESGIADFIKNTIPEKMSLFKNSIKEIFENDISSYDCNIYISESRIIKYRLSFLPDSENNFLVLEDIIQNYGRDFTIPELEKLIAVHPEVIRKRPTYIEIELNTEREIGKFFPSALLKRSGEMKIEDFQSVLDQIARFAQKPVVSLGLFGEPFIHPKISEIIQTVKKYPQMEFLMESRSIANNFSQIEKALESPNVRVIFDLSFSDTEKYSANKKPINSLLPFEGLIPTEEKIKKLNNKERIYIQFTRSTENENDLLKFYEHWKDYSDRIIIKKPDTFGGALNQNRVVDLSPVERFACLHLKHDLVVHFDGNVPLCREDLNGDHLAGNILSDGIEACWKNLASTYQAQWSGDYQNPALCKGCDEWWVFNF